MGEPCMHGEKKGIFQLTSSVFSHLCSSPREFWNTELLLHGTLSRRADVKACHVSLMQKKLGNHWGGDWEEKWANLDNIRSAEVLSSYMDGARWLLWRPFCRIKLLLKQKIMKLALDFSLFQNEERFKAVAWEKGQRSLREKNQGEGKGHEWSQRWEGWK